MRTIALSIAFFTFLFASTNHVYAGSHLGYQVHHAKHGTFKAYHHAKGSRPLHRDYDLDMTTGDDNPYTHPDLQIN